MKVFIIQDWAGNECFQGSTFKTFEDAWEYIYERDPQPEEGIDVANWYSDYEVVERGE